MPSPDATTTWLDVAYRACQILADAPPPPMQVGLQVVKVRRNEGPWKVDIVAHLPASGATVRIHIDHAPDGEVPADDVELASAQLACDLLDGIGKAMTLNDGGDGRVDASLN